jgi:hypothetical protein
LHRADHRTQVGALVSLRETWCRCILLPARVASHLMDAS